MSTTPTSVGLPAPANLAGSWLELPDGGLFWLRSRCTVGRQPDNDLVFDHPTLSRHHALLAASPEGYTLTDLHSSNGTAVNRTRLSRPALLHDGDEIRFGDAAARYRCTRQLEIRDPAARPESTQLLDHVHTRPCWLLLTDIAGFTTLTEQLGSAVALQKLRAWITAARPLVEQNGGQINGYLGDAIFAYWPADAAGPAPVLAALRAIEVFRPHSPLPFRFVVHHGPVLFARGEHGEDLSGLDVNFVFRIEKVAKKFGSHALLSATAATSLGLAGRCPSLGFSPIDGMAGSYEFFALPGDFAAPLATQAQA